MAKDKISPIQREIILAYPDCRMRAAETGRRLHTHHTNVLYHLQQIKRITGLDPNDFYDLWELVEMVKGGESL